MSILNAIGIGAQKTLSDGERAEGIVTKVDTCWWLKINTKPVRTGPLDGAVFPHVIHFTYSAAGKEYTGSRFINWKLKCPQTGEKITVYYDKIVNSKYAVELKAVRD